MTALSNLNRSCTPLGYNTLLYPDAVGRDMLVISPLDQSPQPPNWVATHGARSRAVFDIMDRVCQEVQWGPSSTNPIRTLPADSVIVDHTYDPEGTELTTVRRYKVGSTSYALNSSYFYDE